MAFENFSDEQARTIVNLAQSYAAWMDAERRLGALPYDLKIREINGTRYLYETRDRSGNGKSRGPLDADKQRDFDHYREEKADAKDKRDGARAGLEEKTSLYRALRLPMLPSQAGRILREADRRGLLGRDILVVGTNAVGAYALEANGFIRDAPEETEDFDLAWIGMEAEEGARPLWDMLKAADSSYTVNTERPFQARNRDAYEVEILVAPSRAGGMFRTDQPIPVPLPEQEWLLLGEQVDQILICRDGTPARLVVPDPRYFALQKLWMSDQVKRHPQKRPKDRKQGMALLDAVARAMPRFKLDNEFTAGLPAELLPYFDQWRAQWKQPERPDW
ncbi:GSU2403 family nucleotidyltransferase fold protein [Sphingomonas colocasiae]|uniref:Nucleotidyltransferase domain-containing protein n=1 Tax=Sphingomonas colocasiae TaxID=1848973 RepID=A0ABS7PZT0_9SPHN|nr:GSU2403 family nucleotidyltransferase fold protein [Sphingomonas colocasiae]MBY8823324.1 nucleotidyltransferase domain-containing protein [Sphingomonas colocasiae]MBY8826459.1 nucleotidyltransferase domain-containing protein [Sphingomonas colocasiae]